MDSRRELLNYLTEMIQQRYARRAHRAASVAHKSSRRLLSRNETASYFLRGAGEERPTGVRHGWSGSIGCHKSRRKIAGRTGDSTSGEEITYSRPAHA